MHTTLTQHILLQCGNQAVHIAARNGHVEIIEYLIKERDPTLIDATVQVSILLYLIFVVQVNTIVQDGMKPIHFASIQGNVSVFKVLIKLGSDPRSPRQNDVRNLYLDLFVYVASYIICDCLSKNWPILHLLVFRELLT